MPRFAAIDVGTNSVLLLVADPRPDGSFHPVADRAEITRLGRGVDRTGRLDPDSVRTTVDAVRRFAEEARGLGCGPIACVATSAARDAGNGREFLDRLRREAQVEVEILSGDREAELSFRAARSDFGPGPLVVLDIGGGSTELVYGEGNRIAYARSLDVGSVRFTERFVTTDPPSATERAALARAIDAALAALPAGPAGASLIGIAGTVTTLCAVARSVAPYDPARIHGETMTAAEVEAQCDRLFALPLAERRRLPGMQEKRADVLPCGALILARTMARLSARTVRVSDRGVRWGLLYERYDAGAA